MAKHTTPIEITADMWAGQGKRFANYIIDIIMVYVLVFLFAFFVGIVSLILGTDKPINWIASMNQIQQLAFSALVIISYFGLFESLTQRTVGKYITGTKVVMEDGTTPEPQIGFLRALCRLIPFEQFSFLGDPPRGWHDTITKTLVVDAKKYDEAIYKMNSFQEIGKEE